MPFHLYPRKFWLTIGIFYIFCLTTLYLITWEHPIKEPFSSRTYYNNSVAFGYFTHVYTRPWYRYCEYGIGIIYAIYLYENQNSVERSKSGDFKTIFGIFAVLFSSILVVYGGSSYDKHGLYHWPWSVEAVYNTLVKMFFPITGGFVKNCSF